MPKKSTIRGWSNSRKNRVFEKRSKKLVSELIRRVEPYMFETNEALEDRKLSDLSSDIAKMIRIEYQSDDFVEYARSFAPDVKPDEVDNTQAMLDALNSTKT